MSAIKLSECIPIIHVDGNNAWANNGDIIKCFKMELVEAYASSEADFDLLTEFWYKTLTSLRSGMIVLKQDVFLESEFNNIVLPETTYLQRATKEHFKNRYFLGHECYLFFIYTKTGFIKSTSIKNPFRKLPKPEIVENEIAEINAIFEKEVSQAVTFLNTTRKILVKPMWADEIQDYTVDYFNGFYKDRSTEAKKTSKYYQIGDKLVGSFVINDVRQLPQEIPNISVDMNISTSDYKFYRGFSDTLGLDLKMDHIYSQAFFIEDHVELKEEFESKRSKLFGARKFSSANKIGAKDLKKYLETVERDESIKFVRSHFNLTFFAKNEKTFEANESAITSKFKNMAVRPHYPVGNNLSNIYNNTFFANISSLNKGNTFVTDIQNLTCLISNVTNYKSDKSGIFFNDRIFNTPFKRDIWDSELRRIKARNFMIVAPTGEGKSYLINHILRQLFEEKVNVVINDLGGSFEKFSYLYPDLTLYIRYKDKEPLGVNPFFLPPGEELSTSQLDLLVKFVELLWKREGKLSNQESTSLRSLLLVYYKEISVKRSFPSFYEFVKINHNELMTDLQIEYQFFKVDEFLHMGGEFVTGPYAFILKEVDENKYNPTGKRLVVFEFDEAKQNPLILSVLLLMSSEITRQLCWLDKSNKSLVIYDEFAELLKYGNVLKSVEYSYQAGRKNLVATGIVLQSPTQFPVNDTSASIIDNTQIFYILYNNKGYQKVVDKFNFSSHDHNQLMSIRNNFTGDIRYSEVFLKIGNEGNVVRIETPQEAFLAFLSEGDVNKELMKLYNENGSMEVAIELYKNKINNAA